MKLLASLAFIGMLSSPTLLAWECADIQRIAGVSKEEKQAMVVACEQKKLETASPVGKVSEVLNKDTMTEISSIAKVAGQTVKEVAAELNVAVNDFIKTPVGMLTAGLAVWYVAGDTIETALSRLWKVVGGTFLMVLSTYFFRRYLQYTLRTGEYTTGENRYFWGLITINKINYELRSWKSLYLYDEDGRTVIVFLAWCLCQVVGIILIF
jgi:hypothetical protein